MNVRSGLPWVMVWLRVLLSPLIVLGGHWHWNGRWLSFIVFVALIDDIYDGILARRWDCDTPLLRRADSAADTIFYLGVAATLWETQPQLIRNSGLLLFVLAMLEVIRHVFDRIKFGRAASYHSYFAKMWGLVMAIAVISALTLGGPSWLLPLSLLFGMVADLEGLAMSIVLPRWQNDVKSLRSAARLRRSMLESLAREFDDSAESRFRKQQLFRSER